MGSFSIWHWLIVLLVVVLVFGTKKLRNIGSDLGGAVKGFKEGMKTARKRSCLRWLIKPVPELSSPISRKMRNQIPDSGECEACEAR